MRKLSTIQLLKASLSYGIAASFTIDSWLLLLDRTGLLEVQPGSYLNAPLAVMAIGGIPVTISLFQRLLDTSYRQPDNHIKPVVTSSNGIDRHIPFTSGSTTGTILASVQRSIFGNPPEVLNQKHRIDWSVPVGEQSVMVTESELKTFLEIAHRRDKYQFSSVYFCRKRRPRLSEARYNAYMKLLESAGLIQDRTSGSSGTMVTFPNEAMMVLKHNSGFLT